MSDEMRTVLLTLRDQASLHAEHSHQAIGIANNRAQHVLLTATAIEAESLVQAIDIMLGS